MRALVTGGTGFLGGVIVRQLLERGAAVRVLARPASRTAALEALGVEIARGDILNRDSIEAALDSCDTLFHAAAIYEFWVPDPGTLMRTEVDGTVNALEAARRAATRRVVYTSTALALGEPAGVVGTEDTPHRGYFLTRYERAKHEAEKHARSAIAAGQDVVILKPAGIIGPGDLKPTGQMIVACWNGWFPVIFPGRFSLVDVDDTARAHILAAERAAPGAEYLLSGGVYTLAECVDVLCRLRGRRAPLVGPAFLARWFAAASEAAARVTGRPPLIARETVDTIAHGFCFDGSKAARELGFSYTPLEDSLRRALIWYGRQGLLRRPLA